MYFRTALLILLVLVASACTSLGDKKPQNYEKVKLEKDPSIIPSEGKLVQIYEENGNFIAKVGGEEYDEDDISPVEGEEGRPTFLIDDKIAFTFKESDEPRIRYGDKEIKGYKAFKLGKTLGYINYSREMRSKRFPNAQLFKHSKVIKPHSIKYANGSSIELPELIQENSTEIKVSVSDDAPYLGVIFKDEDTKRVFYKEDEEAFSNVSLGFTDNYRIINGNIYYKKPAAGKEILMKNGESTGIDAYRLDLFTMNVYDESVYIKGQNNGKYVLFENQSVYADKEFASISGLIKAGNKTGYTEGDSGEEYVIIQGNKYGPFQSARLFRLGNSLAYEASIGENKYIYRPK
jgi:hypothetical protein